MHAGYSSTEEQLGAWLKSRPDLAERTYLATKFGGSYERDVAGEPDHGFDISLGRMIEDFENSVKHLGNVDLLYSHVTNQAVPYGLPMISVTVTG